MLEREVEIWAELAALATLLSLFPGKYLENGLALSEAEEKARAGGPYQLQVDDQHIGHKKRRGVASSYF